MLCINSSQHGDAKGWARDSETGETPIQRMKCDNRVFISYILLLIICFLLWIRSYLNCSSLPRHHLEQLDACGVPSLSAVFIICFWMCPMCVLNHVISTIFIVKSREFEGDSNTYHEWEKLCSKLSYLKVESNHPEWIWSHQEGISKNMFKSRRNSNALSTSGGIQRRCCSGLTSRTLHSECL